MAVFSATNHAVVIGGTNFSTLIQSAELTLEAEELDATGFASTYRSRIGGLKTGSLALTFMQDIAAIDATLGTNLGNVLSFEVYANGATAATTNPKYSGSVLINSYSPINAKVGDLAAFQVSFPTSGTVARATS